MKAITYRLVRAHYFFLGTTCLVSTMYASVGKFIIGMAGYLLGAILVSGTEWLMEQK